MLANKHHFISYQCIWITWVLFSEVHLYGIQLLIFIFLFFAILKIVFLSFAIFYDWNDIHSNSKVNFDEIK